MVSALLLATVGTPAVAFPTKLTENGQLDFSYGSAAKAAGGTGTSYKPESKLFTTGSGALDPVRWWSVLGTSGPSPAAGLWIWELENEDHRWDPEIQLPGADPWAKADALFEAGTLYVATRDDKDPETGNPRQSSLYEVPYLGGGNWGAVSGPFPITTSSIETLTIARDSFGRLWVAHESGGKIKVGSTAPSGTSFTFTTLPTTKVKSDDVAAVTAFGGNKIGVFWSDQNAKKDFFAWRPDMAPVTANWNVETAYGGGVGGCPTANSPLCADDHLNVKVYQDQVYVAIKTSLNDAAPSAPGDPLIVLLRRASDGTWSSYPVSPVSQDATRPIVVLSPAESKIWVWATRGSEVDVWESAFGSPAFTSDAFVPWVKGVTANDATSTKQVATEESGVVVVVSAPGKKQYWHNEFLP
jgi:hypothetical protein